MADIALAFALAAASVVLLGPYVIRLLSSLKAGQNVSSDAPKRHLAKQGTPTMGGLLILAGTLLGGLASEDLRGMVVLLGFLAFGFLGFLDDYLSLRRGKNLGLKARHKLAGQVLLALLTVVLLALVSGHSVTPAAVLSLLLSAFVVVFLSNAVNLTDGLDGLASGISFIAYTCTGLILVRQGSPVAPVAFAAAGACLGFLKHNRHPAKVFMGDTGSLPLGAGLGLCLLSVRAPIQGGAGLLFLLLVTLVFTLELLSVVIQVTSYKTTGKRVFRMTPIHHHFELAGWSESRIVQRFWLLSLVSGAAAVALAWPWAPGLVGGMR